MNRLLLAVLFGLVFLSCASDEEKIEKLVQELCEKNEMNGLLFIEDGEKVIFNRALSSTDEYLELPIPDTPLYLASLTKVFTEIVVHRLAEEGKIDLDRTIADYRPEFRPSFGQKISIRHLLDMQSGLPRELNSDDLMHSLIFDSDGKAGGFLDSIQDFSLTFDPGSRKEYSNLNYWLLGSIIESVSGSNLKTAYDRYIFGPLDMRDSGYGIENTAMDGYVYEDGQWKLSELDYTNRYASGGAYSSLNDMVKLVKNLPGKSFLEEESRLALLTDGKLEVFGALPNVTNMLYLDKDSGLKVVLLNNLGVRDLSAISEFKKGIERIFGIRTKHSNKEKSSITLHRIETLNDSVRIEKGMRQWIEAIEGGNKTDMIDIFNKYASASGFTPKEDPTWDEILRVRKEWSGFRVYGYRKVENEEPRGIEVWFRSDTEERVALRWVMGDDGEDGTMALFIIPDNTTWLGTKFN